MWAVKYFQYKNGWETADCDGVADQAVLEKLNGQDGALVAGLNSDVLNRIEVFVPTDLTMDHDLWKAYPFDAANTETVEVIGDSANAPAGIAIAFSSLSGLAITPPVICREALANGWRDPDGETGVRTAFWNGIDNLHDMTYSSTVYTLSDLREYCEAGGIVLIRVIDDDAHGYCSDGGASYLVAYKVDDSYVYLRNANNRSSSASIAISDWEDAHDTWIRTMYGYKNA